MWNVIWPYNYIDTKFNILFTNVFLGICDPNPCGEGAICDSSTGNALCSCPKGRTGDPLLRCGKWNEMMHYLQ